MTASLAGALLVLVGCGALGNQAAQQCRHRPRDLAQGQVCLQVLLTDIDYGLTPLDRALDRAAGAVGGPVALLFRQAAAELRAPRGNTARAAWLQALQNAAGELALTAADIDIFAELAPVLGASDRHHQRRHILLCSQRLAAAEAEARAAAQKNLRLYRYLGLAAGGFLAVLLS